MVLNSASTNCLGITRSTDFIARRELCNGVMTQRIRTIAAPNAKTLQCLCVVSTDDRPESRNGILSVRSGDSRRSQEVEGIAQVYRITRRRPVRLR